MAINKKLISFATEAQFDAYLANNNIDPRSIVFIEETKRIWTHGVFFDTSWDYVTGKPDTYTPSAHTLGSHSDIDITSNTSGEILKWNGTNWINNTLTEANIASLTDLNSYLPLSGGTLTGTLNGTHIIVNDIASTQYRFSTTTWSIVGSLNNIYFKNLFDTPLTISSTGNVTANTFIGALTGVASGNLPLTGGTLTGKLGIQDQGTHKTLIYNSSTAGEALFGVSATGTDTISSYIRVGATKLQYNNGTAYDIWHSGNLANGTTSQYIRGDGSLATYSDTTYSEITEAQTVSTSSSVAGLITGRRLKYAFDNITAANATNANILNRRGDNRGGFKPSDITSGALITTFSTQGALLSQTNNSDYVDVIGLSTYQDSSAGQVNVLAFDKSSHRITHFMGTFGTSSWSSNKTLAYTDGTGASGTWGIDISGNASTATKLASITTTFTGTYPVTFNVNGTIYSHTGITYTGSTNTLTATNFNGNASSATNSDMLDGYHASETAETGLLYTYRAPGVGGTNFWHKLGTLTLPTVTGSGRSKVVAQITGLANFGTNEHRILILKASTRGSVQVNGLMIKGNSTDVRVGYVNNGSNIEVWVGYVGFYNTDTNIEILNSTNFTVNRGTQSSMPTNFVTCPILISATTSSNVASATKLQTARTIWGQSFDGTGNVTGALTGVTTITSSDNITITKTVANQTYVRLNNNNGSVGLWNDTNKGVYIPDSSSWLIGSNNTSTLTFLMQGNVGIGTTSPAYKLDVSGTGRFTGNVTAPTFVGALSGNATTANYLSYHGVTDLDAVTNTGVYRQEQPSSGYPYTSTLNMRSSDGRQQLTISRDGSGMKFRGVNSGSGTTGWTAWKEVYHSGNLSAVTINTAQTITAQKTFNDGDTVYGINARPSIIVGDGGTTKAGAVRLNGNVAGAYALIQATTTALHIDMSSSTGNIYLGNYSTGNIGLINNVGIGKIGTGSYKLDVEGTGRFSGSLNLYDGLNVNVSTAGDGGWSKGIIVNSTSSTAGEATIAFTNNSTGANYWIAGINQSADFDIAYGTTFSNAATKLRITAAGNVGIGTTSPQHKLDVAGTARFTGMYIPAPTGNNAITSNGNHIFNVRSGETWAAPGVLGAIVIRADTKAILYRWSISPIVLTIGTYSGGFSLIHNLGHTEYVAVVTHSSGNGGIRIASQTSTKVDFTAVSVSGDNQISVILVGRYGIT